MSSYTLSFFNEHIGQIQQVWRRITTLSAVETEWTCIHGSYVDYLGQVTWNAGMKAKPHRLDVIFSWQAPPDPTKLLSFLRFGYVFRWFVEDTARMAAPLNSRLQKSPSNIHKELSDMDLNALHLIHLKGISPPVLALPRMKLMYTVDSNY